MLLAIAMSSGRGPRRSKKIPSLITKEPVDLKPYRIPCTFGSLRCSHGIFDLLLNRRMPSWSFRATTCV
jgi:hypothetical protein